ncbi:hypothetical protein [Shimia sp. MIT1388]|uniref:hypothetical protein n=1 Tax=Shimia sp. MIT1388 TaxID=3096992 RepID=UPI0039995711
MTNTQNTRTWPLIERISPKAAALLQEASEMDNVTFDFETLLRDEPQTRCRSANG